MKAPTLLKAIREPKQIELVELILLGLFDLSREALFNCDFASILLTQQDADNGTLKLSLVSACDEI